MSTNPSSGRNNLKSIAVPAIVLTLIAITLYLGSLPGTPPPVFTTQAVITQEAVPTPSPQTTTASIAPGPQTQTEIKSFIQFSDSPIMLADLRTPAPHATPKEMSDTELTALLDDAGSTSDVSFWRYAAKYGDVDPLAPVTVTLKNGDSHCLTQNSMRKLQSIMNQRNRIEFDQLSPGIGIDRSKRDFPPDILGAPGDPKSLPPQATIIE